ncbi:MAG: AmmeMemoRadiSam system protein B [Deltaproteobacteria bacterium]|nr:AmmeMemoRadiSam system protein B [Deltaproteobacteria bacterium]
MFVRLPAVSGSFYPDKAQELQGFLKQVMKPESEPYDAIVSFSPHAGYIYSGEVAAAVFSSIKPADVYIILGPNHTGLGKPIALIDSGVFRMPLGDVGIDEKIGEYLLSCGEPVERDAIAHKHEHSIEVQLPFLQYISSLYKKDFSIVPVVIGTQNYNALKALGEYMAKAIERDSRNVMIIVSTDMNHYENQELTLEKDRMALEKIEKLDEKGLLNVTVKYNISMCGVSGAVSAIVASKLLGAKKAIIIEHKTSGDVSGDYEHVVGYAAAVII